MSSARRRAMSRQEITVDGVGIPPELAAGWLDPVFDAPTPSARSRLYYAAVDEFAAARGLVKASSYDGREQLDWAALRRLGIRPPTALERARLQGMIR